MRKQEDKFWGLATEPPTHPWEGLGGSPRNPLLGVNGGNIERSKEHTLTAKPPPKPTQNQVHKRHNCETVPKCTQNAGSCFGEKLKENWQPKKR